MKKNFKIDQICIRFHLASMHIIHREVATLKVGIRNFLKKKLQTLGSRSGSNELVGSRLIYFIELISVKLVAPPSRCCLNVLIDFLNIQSFTCPWDSLI